MENKSKFKSRFQETAFNEINMSIKETNNMLEQLQFRYGLVEERLRNVNNFIQNLPVGLGSMNENEEIRKLMDLGWEKDKVDRLISHKPLTAITEEDIAENNCTNLTNVGCFEGDNKLHYMCKRYAGLNKTIDKFTNEVIYSDCKRWNIIDICNNYNLTEKNAKVIKDFLDKKFPITIPYYPPTNSYQVIVEDINANTVKVRAIVWDENIEVFNEEDNLVVSI